jgi:glycine cleavage system H protein
MHPHILIVTIVCIAVALLGLVIFPLLGILRGGLRLAVTTRTKREPIHDPALLRWFSLPQGFYYHRGHAWVKEDGTLFRIGVDDFAQKLIGIVERVEVPEVGTRLVQGEKGWRFKIGARAVHMLCPVSGEVVGVNTEAVRDPRLINLDPYGEGWLLLVRPDNKRRSLVNLFSGEMARLWLEESVNAVMGRAKGRLRDVLQDGGTAVSGLARVVAGEDWDSLVEELFLSED